MSVTDNEIGFAGPEVGTTSFCVAHGISCAISFVTICDCIVSSGPNAYCGKFEFVFVAAVLIHSPATPDQASPEPMMIRRPIVDQTATDPCSPFQKLRDPFDFLNEGRNTRLKLPCSPRGQNRYVPVINKIIAQLAASSTSRFPTFPANSSP